MIVLRANNLTVDTRVEKYISFFKRNNISYKIIGWNREGKRKEDENIIYFNLLSSHGDGNKNILKLIKWNIFLLKKLIENRKYYKIIHACDFDTILPAILMKFIGKKVIFDIFDWYSDSRNFNNKIVYKIILFLETFAVMKANKIIICENERQKQIPIKIPSDKLEILPNIPDLEDTKYRNKKEVISKNIRISYVGILSEERGIEELLEVVSKNNKLELHIAGFGSLEPLIESYSKKYKNIIFYSKVSRAKGIEIMEDSTLLYAMYYRTNKNHIFAAPNKYYEGLFLGKPIITTKGTLVGDKTQKYKTGFVIEEGEERLSEFFYKEIKDDKIIEYSKNAKSKWRNEYRNYVENFLNKNYLSFIGE